MMRIWNQEKDNYLIEIHKGRSNTEIADLMNKKFKTNFSVSAINSRKRVLNLISNYKYMPKYSREIIYTKRPIYICIGSRNKSPHSETYVGKKANRMWAISISLLLYFLYLK